MIFAQPDPDWIIGKNALLCVEAARREGRTELNVVRRRIPYQWQGYQFQDRDDQPYLLLHNSNGGYVEDDSALLQVNLQPASRVLLTTTGATKFYHCRNGGHCEERVDIAVGEDALLEFIPDEVIPYADTRAIRSTHLDLARSARLFFSDTLSAGRINFRDGERFAFRSLQSELSVRIDGRLEILDRQYSRTPQEVRALDPLWNGFRHLTTIIAYAPDMPSALEERLNDLLSASPHGQKGVTRLGNLLCLRLLTIDAWHAQKIVFDVWKEVRPALAGKPARAIWKC